MFPKMCKCLVWCSGQPVDLRIALLCSSVYISKMGCDRKVGITTCLKQQVSGYNKVNTCIANNEVPMLCQSAIAPMMQFLKVWRQEHPGHNIYFMLEYMLLVFHM